MLHTETLPGTTLQLLTTLEKNEILSAFSLAGGTAIALYLGHRRSIDLDFFSPYPFDVEKLKTALESTYHFRTDFMAKNTLKGGIGNVKMDCITHAYPVLAPYHTEDGIRLYGIDDLIAMKLSAISDNGTRLKDFIDIAFLSTRFSFLNMLKFYERKYSDSNIIRPMKALTYFDDIDFGESIVMLQGNYRWKNIERRLTEMAQKQEQVFNSFPF